MAFRHLLAGVALATAALAGFDFAAALAQEAPIPSRGGDICDRAARESVSPGEETPATGSATACARSQANIITLIQVQEAVAEVVADRLLGLRVCRDNGCPEPAGLRLGDPAAIRSYLSGGGGFVIAPAAEVTAAAPLRMWNAWANGKFSWTETGQGGPQPTDGPLFNLTAGIDRKFGERVVAGLLASFESSDLDSTGRLPTSTETQGWGGGFYVGVTLTDHLVFSGLVSGIALDTDLDTGGASADPDSERLQASGGITGYWYFGQTRWSPSLSLAWSREWQEDYVDSAGVLGSEQTLETAILTAGSQIGHTLALANGTAIEPWAGAQLDWTFVNSVEADGPGDIDEDDTLDLRLQAGFNWALAGNAQLSLTGEAAGLLLSDSETYSGEVNLAIQF